ncbi:Thymidylate kinase, partial [hydrothermal vent metagenome]
MTRHSFSFTGNAKEYFGIWIVNLFLSVITIGIYTAWAKVRRVRYFYGNTHLDGHNFEYHANPKSILIGRIIVLGFLLLLNVLSAITPFALLLLVPYLIAFPWIINKSMRFNARVTSYRNIRFNFAGSYWRAAGVFILLPLAFLALLVAVVSLVSFLLIGSELNGGLLSRGAQTGLIVIGVVVGLVTFCVLAPLMSKLSSNYIGNNLSFGAANFSTNAKFKPMLGNFFITLLFALVAGAVLAFVGNFIGAILGNAGLFDLVGIPEDARDGNDAMTGGLVFSGIGGY